MSVYKTLSSTKAQHIKIASDGVCVGGCHVAGNVLSDSSMVFSCQQAHLKKNSYASKIIVSPVIELLNTWFCYKDFYERSKTNLQTSRTRM